jgi:hypothetical protein
MERTRITISGKRLAAVIYVWLRHVPKWVWGEEPGYAKLKAQKRHDPRSAPDAQAIAADHIAAELERLGWEVSYEEPSHLGSPPAWREDEPKT